MSSDERRIDQDTLSYLKQELQRLESEFEQGRHTGKKAMKAMVEMKKIREQIASGNFSEEATRNAVRDLEKAVRDSETAKRQLLEESENAVRYAEVVPAIQYYQEILQRLERRMGQGRPTGMNEKRLMGKMKMITQKIQQVVEKGDDWPEEAAWVQCWHKLVRDVGSRSDPPPPPAIERCRECDGLGYKLKLRKKIE